MILDQTKKTILFSYIALFFLGGLLRYIDQSVADLPVRLLAVSHLLFISACIMFMFFMRKDILYIHTRRYLMAIGILLVFRKTVELLMQNLYPISTPQTRLLFYLQYIPINFIPNCVLLAIVNASHRYEEKIPRKWYITFIASTVISLGFLTNDWHQQAMAFPAGVQAGVAHFAFGPVFLVSEAWIFFCFTLAIVIVSRLSGSAARRGAWSIAAVIIAGSAYTIWFSLKNRMLYRHSAFFSDVDIWIICLILCIEIAIRFGLIRSNFNYIGFFEASTLSAQLEDSSGIRFQTRNIIPSTAAQRKDALTQEVYLDRNHRLRGRNITGGQVFWVENIEDVNRGIVRLEDTRRQLSQENDLIKSENDMIARSAKAEEQNRLYNLLAKRVQPQIDKIEAILQSTSEDDPEFLKKIIRACVYKAYIKRLSNMALLAQENPDLHLFELLSAMHETGEYVSLNPNIKTEASVTGEGQYPAELLMFAYSFCQEILENILDIATAIDVHVHGGPGYININIRVDGDEIEKRHVLSEETRRRILRWNGHLDIDRGADTITIRIENLRGNVYD